MSGISISIGDAVRLPGASGKYGDIFNISIIYTANSVPKTILYIRTLSGDTKVAFSHEVKPLYGTLTGTGRAR